MELGWEQLGEQTAAALQIEGRASGGQYARSLQAALRQIRQTRDRASQWSVGQRQIPQAVEWLLDNWYLAQREGSEAVRAFRRTGRLREVRHSTEHLILIVGLGRGLAARREPLDQRGFSAFLNGFQRLHPLTERELSLVVSAFRGALVERLALACTQLEKDGWTATELAAVFDQIFTSFRTLSILPFGPLLEEASQVEQALRQDPAGLYPEMEEGTRNRYRTQLCQLARKHGLTEWEAAQRVLSLCEQGSGEERHVGWYLFRVPMGEPVKCHTGGGYIAAVVLPTLFFVLLLGFRLHSWVVTLLLLLPVSDIVKNLLDFLAVRVVSPRPVCRMALEGGIPAEGKTLCVIAGLLTGEDSGGVYTALMERYRLANRDAGDQLLFGLLADLPDRALPMGSEARRTVAAAQRAVDALNEKHGGGFYLFFRPPVFQPTDERYVGWERKRGALLELVRLLKGRRTGLTVRSGDRRALNGVKYVITLDSDTSLNVGTAKELVGAMLHPLNRAKVDPRRRIVTAGYGLLQPRVGVELNAANRSQFSRIFAGQGGVDPYGSTTSDVYHDLFDQGTYTGKGIFDVDAFFTCLDGRFPENTILSHDLLEGSYLHAGLIGDIELTDGYPYKVTSYFARLHRWIRGDWQLLPWLGRTVSNQFGGVELNPISSISKWKIFDNLRRSLSPVCTLLALLLGMCLAGADFTAAAAAAILAAWSNLLLSSADLAFRGGQGLRNRYHSTIIAGLGGVILQTLVQLLFLPLHAWTCASAICTALWRSYITHKERLAWVTAADAERKSGDGIGSHYRKGWSCVAAGGVAVLFSRFPAGAAVGLVWICAPIFSWALSRPINQKRTLSTTDRAFLLHQGALIWQYFSDFLGPENHWLPPDNWQEQPAVGLARRTSPTNLGMALLCCLAAVDLDFITRERAVALIGHMLDTAEALPKWRGHLYNWYDTATAKPLFPRYVSTVDGGNLCGCLIALREGLYEWGEDVLARRAETLANGMDFSLLYDAERKLFTIGYDVEAEQYTPGWYDLMASEARQTSYIAVAQGQVAPRHWRRLSRMLVGDNDYSGMASWTGTMFEYFMPNLLLPIEPNSLMYESLAFCLYEQRRRTGGKVPWGISESGFYAFDGGLSYQYKAHGVQKLGLKRDLDLELVIAPYASFLALLLAPGRAGRNLRRLRDLGAEGKYGLYEALDFTSARLTGERSCELVKSYMAHHLGMSLTAIDNALNNNIMQQRFLRDCNMSAYRELLQEKVPVGASVMKSPSCEIPDKPKRLADPGLVREGTWTGGRPACHLVSNGAYTVFCASDGTNYSKMGETALTTRDGISFYLSTAEGLLPLRPGFWHFDSGAAWETRIDQLTAVQTLQVPGRENGELRDLVLEWRGETPLRGELVCYLEPVLARQIDYDAHPAFSKLFLESAYTGDGVVFTRRPRSQLEGRPALAVLWDAPEAFFDTSREVALGRGGRHALQQALEGPAHSTAGAVLDPCLLVRIPFKLAKGEQRSFRFALAASDSSSGAVQAALRLLELTNGENILGGLLQACKLSREEAFHAYKLLKNLAYPARHCPIEPSTLWPFGISGDVPIAAAEIEGLGEAEAHLFWLGAHKLLCKSGFSFDLVFLIREGGDYRRPARSSLLEGLHALQWEHMLGAKGGVHLVDACEPVKRAATILLDSPEEEIQESPISEQENHFTIEPGAPRWEFGADGTFRCFTGPRLPPLGWSQILTNGSFGWMPDETGCGHLWLDNAREHQLTPWCNDPLAIGGPEEFWLQAEEERCALFAGGDGLSCTVTYGPGFARWEKQWGSRHITTTAFVPMEEQARILLITLKGEPCKLFYQSADKAIKLYRLDDTIALVTTPEETKLRPSLGQVRKLLNQTTIYWNRQVSALHFHTPDEMLNHYLNGWALYQVLACRLMGRTSRYQNGGAFGFRDQLQDVCATLLQTGEYAKTQILRACAHQYREGDVQHWWHEDQDGRSKGVRTRISDDLLWLPYTLCAYLEQRGDWTILREETPYLCSPILGDEEVERYEQPTSSEETDSVYRHAVLAVEQALTRGTGIHGLSLMGTGDWNDGMNRVGIEGRGESVWLTWFTAAVLESFAPICARMGEPDRAEKYRQTSAALAQAAGDAWDGSWFLRGYYDDGTPLGTSGAAACTLDSIAQSWAVLAPGDHRDKAVQGVQAALDRLFDREAGLIKLFTPAFDGGEQDPGYIGGYVPGVRENGGQYTHAAVWLALACLRLGMAEEGYDILRTLLPAHHDTGIFKTEPFVLAADVYSNPAHLGRGGWSWYTGAAGWYYRTATEVLLGFQLRENRLFIEPVLPEHWSGYTAVWRTEKATCQFSVRRGEEKGTYLDGCAIQTGIDMNQMEGEHMVEVVL
ncbi:MAG: hypothetical protein HFE97_12750 [Oscillospiraceae bacterium]|nr:hypothetical protein [Oscillospiraceae bacterium]